MATELNYGGGDTYLATGLKTAIAGERQTDSLTGADHLATANEWAISAAIAAGTGATVYSGPAILGGIWVETTVAVGTPTITDGGTTRLSVPIAIPIGEHIFGGIIFENNLVVAAGASATGSFRVLYRPLPAATTWAY